VEQTTITQPSKAEAVLASIEVVRRKCRQPGGFKFFINHVFSASFGGDFVGGDYVNEIADRMEREPWTMDVTARGHFKSTRLYAEVMYDIFTMARDIEGWYFSYNTDLSSYHLKKLKGMIKRNPFFIDVYDGKAQAEGILSYTRGNATYTCTPAGLLAFKRGIHADRIYVDDPLRDPENKLAPTVIIKINRVIATEIYPMVNKGGKCRVVGTPQTNDDFFYDKSLRNKWDVRILDAMKDEANRIALWPEWTSFDELEDIRNTIGEKTFNQEYRARPAYSEDSRISRELIQSVIDPDMKPADEYEGGHDVVGGLDIGKHRHPSHLVLFERWELPQLGRDGEVLYMYRQLLSKWLDGMNYNAQWDYLLDVVALYNIDVLRYDNTRGEFEAFYEKATPQQQNILQPVVFGLKNKNAMAAEIEALMTSKRITLLNDQRQTSQVLAVTSDLNAFETAEGHGDSFWSIGLATKQEKENAPRVRTV
jgi:hypothetical protein